MKKSYIKRPWMIVLIAIGCCAVTLAGIVCLVIVGALGLTLYSYASVYYLPSEGIWETEDGNAYLDFDHPDGPFGTVTVDGKEYLVYFWCYPKNPSGSFGVVDEFSQEAVFQLQGQQQPTYASIKMKYRKEYFTVEVTESNFMDVGTKLTFYKVDDTVEVEQRGSA